MKTPKALILIDLQTSFITKRNAYILKNIEKHILKNKDTYDLFVVSFFKSDKNSIWHTQQGNRCPDTKNDTLSQIIKDVLPSEKTIHVHKSTKSVFKGDKNLIEIFKKNKIREVHIAGIQTNDCVLATAYESFDLGFLTYVIEECCESGLHKSMHTKAIDLLRHQNMTNHSKV